MGCASSEVDQAQNSQRRSRKPAHVRSDRAILGLEFESFGDEIRQELDPTGSLERLLADYLIQAAWRLKLAIEGRGCRLASPMVDDNPKTIRSNARATVIERASRAVREAFEVFEACRSLRTPKTSAILFEVRSQSEPLVEPNEWPIVPPLADPADADADETPHWRDRLVFDLEVSETSPVVKGTWVTVGHVVSLIVDGWTWADILRAHPELTEDDIRACVTYTMDEETSTR